MEFGIGRTATIQPIVSMGRNLLISSAMAAHRGEQPPKKMVCTVQNPVSFVPRVTNNEIEHHRPTPDDGLSLFPISHTLWTDRRRLNPKKRGQKSSVSRAPGPDMAARHEGSDGASAISGRGGRAAHRLAPKNSPAGEEARQATRTRTRRESCASYPTADAFDRTFVLGQRGGVWTQWASMQCQTPHRTSQFRAVLSNHQPFDTISVNNVGAGASGLALHCIRH